MSKALTGLQSYTLIKNGKRVSVKRGQTIDHLDEDTQNYLSRVSIQPPTAPDSEIHPMRQPVFTEIVPDDAKGKAAVADVDMSETVRPAAAAPTSDQPVVVNVQVTPPSGEGAGGDDSGGDTEADEGDDAAEEVAEFSEEVAAASKPKAATPKKKPGRPKGSKNQKATKKKKATAKK